jgi:Uma2 family endonuclease
LNQYTDRIDLVMQAVESLTLYDRLQALPEGLTGEILNGQLHAQPRPAGPHARAESVLQIEIGGPFDRGKGGPGGWWILMEPELHFVRDTEVCVPDLAGWRRTRMAEIPRDQRFEVVPDWICEILSPSTESKDRQVKMPIYAHYGVAFAWLIDPLKRVLEVFELDGDDWKNVGLWRGEAEVVAPPFESVPFNLGGLWS